MGKALRAGIAAVLLGLAGPASGDDVLRLGEALSGPAREGPFEAVSLPERWAGPGEAEALGRWYRLQLAPAADGGLQGVLLRDVAMNAEVFWNGERLGDGGRFDPPIAQNFHRPLYFPVPATLAGEPPGLLEIRVATAAHFYGWLGALEVGPDAVLRPRFEDDWFWRVTIPQAATALCVAMVCLLVAFALAARDPSYAWFALATATWTVAHLNLHVRDLPISTMPWARLVQLALLWTPALFAVHVHRLLGVERPRVERGLAVYGGLGLLLALAIPDPLFLGVFTATHLSGLAIGLYGFSVIATRLSRLSRLETAVLAASFAVLLAIGLHDTAVQFGDQEGTPRYWNAMAAPAFILGFATVLGVRFVGAFRRAERLNEELDERVRAREEELAANFERVRDLERDRARADERERMMREVHDGLGGRLVETLSAVEMGDAASSEIADQLRGALDEMRLLIDSLDPETDDLAAVLAAARDRLEPGLRRRSVALDWDVTGLGAEDLRLGPQRALHVLRIVQEAFTNVLKHAEARRVALSARRDEAAVEIVIEDDGKGMIPGGAPGRGLRNIRSRARALHGRVEIAPRPPGTRLQLRFPI